MTNRRTRTSPTPKPVLTLERYRHVTDPIPDTSWAVYSGVHAYVRDVETYQRATGKHVPWNDQSANDYAGEVASDRGEETPEAPAPNRAQRRAAKKKGPKK